MRVTILNPSFVQCIAFLFVCVTAVSCWENYELDLFDLVEEIGTGQTFYEYFGVDKKCDAKELKQAYRRLSLQFHPDKNSEPDAEIKFRQIVGINEVLKDEVKRARYEQILEFGLPDWRTPLYYFRRARKLSLLEIIFTLSLIISIGHYFVMWAQYFETRLCLEERLGEVRKKLEKKAKKKRNAADLDEMDSNLTKFYDSMPSPSFQRTLPYRFAVWSFTFTITIVPILFKSLLNKVKPEKKVDSEDESDYVRPSDLKKSNDSELHKQLNPQKIEKSNISVKVIDYQNNNQNESNRNEPEKPEKAEWSDKQKSDLIKAIAKFPAGSLERWSKISEMVGRPAKQCIDMEKLARSNFNFFGHTSSNVIQTKKAAQSSESPEVISKISLPTKADESVDEEEDKWTQDEQSQLENALKEIKKDVPNRWDRIAEKIPNKTKDECIKRFKILCAVLKKN